MENSAVTMDVDAIDMSALAAEASEFSSTLGIPSDEVTEQFLNRYPIPVLFRAMETGEDLANMIIATLDKVFNTKIGSVALLQSLPYAKLGLEARSASTRRMTCIAVSKLFENNADSENAVQAVIKNDVLPPLLKAITDGDPVVATAASEAIQNLAKVSSGTDILFKENGVGSHELKVLALKGSSLVRIRIFSIIAHLFGHSKQSVPAIMESGILNVLESELSNGHDVLSQLNTLELLHEIAVTADGAKFLTEGGLLQKLISIIGDPGQDNFVRSRSMMVGARLISPDDSMHSVVSKEDAMKIIGAIEQVSRTNEDSKPVEEAAIDAVGRVGMSKIGAELLCQNFAQVVRRVLQAAFSRKAGSEQLVSIHALASVAGSERAGGPLLSDDAEKCLKDLIYSELESSGKWSLSDVIYWFLQQTYEVRLAAYRLIVPLAGRSWFVMDICSKKDVVNFLTDPHVETVKEGMEWRHSCCVSIRTSLERSGSHTDSGLNSVFEKFQSAVANGPYLSKDRLEPRAIVVTQERF